MSRPTEPLAVRPATADDAEAIVTIYNHYIAHTTATFEESAISADEMWRRMQDVQDAAFPWLVAEEQQHVVGYAYATRWRTRSGYRFSAEVTVYLAPESGGRGVGSALYAALFPLLRARGVHAVMGGIALPNDASIALHEKFGMRKVAHFDQVGFKFAKWVDVGYWQAILVEGQ